MYREAAIETERPPPPSLKLDRIVAVARDLEQMFQQDIGLEVTCAMAARWAYNVHLATDHSQRNLVATFQQYTGNQLTRALARVLAWQVASLGDRLDDGLLPAYARPTRPEWVACEINTVHNTVWRDGRRGVTLDLFALAGHPAGNVLQRKVPAAWLSWFAYQVGFTRAIQYDDDPRHFVGLRFWGFLQPKPESNDIDFTSWELSAAFKKHNKRIIKLRTRFDYEKAECPLDLDHACWDCPHRRTTCPASPHPT